MRQKNRSADRYGTADDANGEPTSAPYHQLGDGGDSSQHQLGSSSPRSLVANQALEPRTETAADSDSSSEDSDDEVEMNMEELLYSSSSYYAIAKPVSLTMTLASIAVVYVNTDQTRASGEQAMANAYQMWNIQDSSSNSEALALSLANALVMVSVICFMTFGIVVLYRYRCMKCLIGYMMFCSTTLLGVLGGNLLSTAIQIYVIPVDKITFFLFVFNFAIVGVLAIYFGQGIPKKVTQGYLIAVSVILAWHLAYFDDWTTWTLLVMLALYDLCAVLTPCGPLKALVELMSADEAPSMPGLLFEAELPAETKRPGVPNNRMANTNNNATGSAVRSDNEEYEYDGRTGAAPTVTNKVIDIPLAVAKVYNLPVLAIPEESKRIMCPERPQDNSAVAAAQSPLLQEQEDNGSVSMPANPTPKQLRCYVTVKLPEQGGRIEPVSRKGKKVFLERDRFGNPKRILWVDREGKVFAEMESDDEEGARNSIRLGLGDFIFYSVLVSKAAQYSFATFTACMLVILAGLGGTLVLLSVYHHALPALPISIFLGVFFYLLTRAFVEPWIEAVLVTPYYV